MLLCSATFVHAQAKQSLTFQATHASVQAKLFDNISDSCKPSPANDPSCNPLPQNTAAWRCPACNDTAQRACAESSAATRGFCAYAGMQSDGRPSDEHPLCPLTGKPAALSPPHSPSDAYVSVGAEFRCSPAFVSHRGRAQPCLKHLPPVPNLHSSRPLALRPQPARPHPTHTVQRHRATKPARAPPRPLQLLQQQQGPGGPAVHLTRVPALRGLHRSRRRAARAAESPTLLGREGLCAEPRSRAAVPVLPPRRLRLGALAPPAQLRRRTGRQHLPARDRSDAQRS